MTPAARIAAAIEILDRILAGAPAEQALTNWARASRFAGSGDRAAIRDHVFTALRCRRSHAALGGAETGRGLTLGQLRESGTDPATLFTGEGHAPAPLTAEETAHLARPVALSGNVALDCPDWLAPLLSDSLGADFAPIMTALRQRAPVFLRVNAARASRDLARARLAEEGIATRPHPLAETALEVTANPRRVQGSAAYLGGLVELQDAASQAVVDLLPLAGRRRILDYCAGGGGKTLAMAAAAPEAEIFAYDAEPRRMADLPARAARAGAAVTRFGTPDLATAAPFDLVLCDVPCSGSGAWRRAPEGKWRLTPERLAELTAIQARILADAARLVAPGGALVYVTCSMIAAENIAQIEYFGQHSLEFERGMSRALTPLDGGDGFFLASFTRLG